MTNQSDRQASVRAVTGTTLPYEGDWHALWDLAGIPLGTYNERMLAWINQRIGGSYTELNGAMAAFAQNQGFTSWAAMGTFDASGSPVAPANTVAPSISGTPTQGQTLTANNGTWTGSPYPSFTYQWKRNGADISGATNQTYLLVVGDVGTNITVTVTGTNGSGSASATSAAVGPVAALPVAPANTVAPVVSGSTTQGSILTSTTGTWTGTPTPTYTYQWNRGGLPISGATSSTYMTVLADVGSNITCTVTGTNTAGSASATSNSVGPITASFNYDSIANLKGWFDASDAATITFGSGSNVAQWGNKADAANNAAQATSTNQPVYNATGLNSRPTLTADGNDALDLPNLITFMSAGMTAVFVMYMTDNGSNKGIAGSRTAFSGGIQFRTNTAEFPQLVSNGVGVRLTSSTAFTSNVPAILMYDINAAGTAGEIYLNGTPVGSASGFTAFNDDVFALLNSGMLGGMSIALIYDRELTDSEKNQIGNKAGTDWGITWTNI